jgi:HEAT repeat protein
MTTDTTAAAKDYAALVELLGDEDPSQRWAAWHELMAAGMPAAAAVREGLSHPDWHVRRGAALYADHHPDPALLERLKLTLNDPHAKVRLFAVHALACEPCKPGGNPVDAIPLLIRALKEDRAIRVRRHAALLLTQQPLERRVLRAFRWSLQHETDEKLLRAVRRGLRAAEQAATAGEPDVSA